VVDVEALVEHLAGVRQHPGQVGGGGDAQVRRGNVHSGRQGPHVKVVDVGDALDPGQGGGDVGDVEAGRGGLQQDAQRVASQLGGAGEDEQAHRHGDDGVGVRPAGERDDDGGDDDTGRAQQVAQHLEVGAADVDALRRSRTQNRQRHQVGDETDGGDDQHRGGRHLGRAGEAPDRFVQHPGGHAEQQHRVGQGRDHLEAVQAEGAPGVGGGPAHRDDRRQRHGDAERVGGHVRGVRQQGQGVGQQAADQLGEHDRPGDGQAEPQPAPVLVAQAGRAVIVTRAHMSILPFS
jgi:hypothetical protein